MPLGFATSLASVIDRRQTLKGVSLDLWIVEIESYLGGPATSDKVAIFVFRQVFRSSYRLKARKEGAIDDLFSTSRIDDWVVWLPLPEKTCRRLATDNLC